MSMTYALATDPDTGTSGSAGPPALRELVAGSNTLMLTMPRCAPPLWPPSTMMRPSAICSMPVQKMSDGAGTAVNTLVVGFQTLALTAANDGCPSYMNTLPLGINAAFT